MLVAEAATLPAVSRASATISTPIAGVTPAKEAVNRHVLVNWSRIACPMLLRLRKNSTPTTEPSESVAVAVKLAVEAVVAATGTLRVTVGARPTRLVTTTRRDTALTEVAPAVSSTLAATVKVPAAAGVQIAR